MKNVLVIGAASSGKSAWAEKRCLELGVAKIYVATMSDQGHEAKERIERHRSMRANKGFITVEPFCGGADSVSLAACLQAARAALPSYAQVEDVLPCVALVEDLGNLVSNRLFKGDEICPFEAAYAQLKDDIDTIEHTCMHTVFVGNDMAADGLCSKKDAPALRIYAELLGRITADVAQSSTQVVEVVAGYPVVLKGSSVYARD
ncbi:MAG: bifunctional adenosylcobinamide kinase/adenosylcobinamide-phosphate guanylyltransferase [Atopobiaceae bacterium]|jgi:adenosylcobinamide kinase/adenosylcobinamide-phosphate guanylyltransferase